MRTGAGLPARHRLVLAVARLVFTIRHPDFLRRPHKGIARLYADALRSKCMKDGAGALESVDIIADSPALS
ncbi:hypothetical protein [Mesorhizobium sp. LjNodule214]|uniref:hypothetical protein n=1 Tax=Mesorhizobium sp. LjNodule214 TaxID=3342252 RepID=UPI003ED075D2